MALDRPEFLDAATHCARAIARPACGRRTAAPGQPRRRGRRQRGDPGGPRGAGDRPADAVPGHRASRLAGRPRPGCSTLALEHFADPERPGRWFDTADDAEQLMVRPADPVDGATPSGASLIAEALQLAAHLARLDRAQRYARGGRGHAARGARRSAGAGAALGRALAGGRRGRGARARSRSRWPAIPRDSDAAGRGAAAGTRAARSSSAARWTPRSCWPAATGSAGATRPTCAAAGCATCPSPPPRISPPRWECPCSVPHMSFEPERSLQAFVKRYLDTSANGTADDVAALYAEDATLEDPGRRRRSAHRARRPSPASTRRSKAPRSRPSC